MISVIIPVYNVESYLENCISSICENTFRDLEIICINDGSTDSSLAILQHRAEEDARIRIIDQKNQGVHAARNAGIQEAKGEYIAFVDADDFVHPQFFQSLYDGIDQNDADLAICGCIKTDQDKGVFCEKYETVAFRKVSGKQFFDSYYPRHMCWGRLYRKTVIADILFNPEVRLGEDTLFNLLVISRLTNPSVYVTETPLYCYYQRKGSLFRASTYRDAGSLAEWVQRNYQCDEQKQWSWMLLMQAIKIGLSCRYEANLHKDHTYYRHMNQILDELFKQLRKNTQISTKEKAVHMLMRHLPQVYRHYRIKSDPTMKKWESIVHERQANG